MANTRIGSTSRGDLSEDAGHEVFISYSRADGDFVRELQQALESRNRRTWVDWQDIPPTAEWMAEISAAIDASDAVVFVISPDSAASRVCGEELEDALASNKRIVPIVARAVDPGATPDALSRLNWIIAEDGNLGAVVDRLVEALDTDLDRVRAHSRLLVRAREWAAKGEDAALLLRGSDLAEAEAFMGADVEPRPTPDQTRFIVASRRATTGRQRRAILLVTVALVLAAALGVFAWTQRGTAITERDRAERQTKITTSRELATQALDAMDKQPDLGSLLSIEAYRAWPTAESAQAIHVAEQQTASVQRVLRDHSDWVTTVAFSPDSRLIAAASQDGTVTVSSVASGRVVTAPLQLGHPAYSVAFSPDGTLLAVGGRQVTIWNTSTWKLVRAPLDEGGVVYSVAFSPDGRLLAEQEGSGKVLLRDTRSWHRSGRPMRAGYVLAGSVAFSPDGRFLIEATQDDVPVWDVATRKLVADLHTSGPAGFESVAFSRRSHLLAAGNNDGQVSLWSTTKWGRPTQTFSGAAGGDVLGVSFDRAGDMLASTTGDGEVMLWDVVTGEGIGDPLVGHDGPVETVAFSPDGSLLASGGDDGTVVLRSAPDDVRLGVARGGAKVSMAAFSIDRQEVATEGTLSAAKDARIAVSDTATGRLIATGLRGQEGQPWCVAFSPEGTTAAVGFKDGTVHLFDSRNGRSIGHVLTGHHGAVMELTFSPDGHLLASGGRDQSTIVWNVKSGEQASDPLTGQHSQIDTVAFSPDGRVLASGGFFGRSIFLWDTSSWRRVRSLSQRGQVSELAFSPDGHLLASGSEDASVTLWDPATGRRVGSPLLGLKSGVYWLAFSPDGRLLAAVDSGGRIVVWDVATGQEIGDPASAHAGSVHGFAFDRDGGLLSVGEDGRVVRWGPELWTPDVSPLADRLCSVEARNLTTDEWNQYFPGEPYHRTCPQWSAGS